MPYFHLLNLQTNMIQPNDLLHPTLLLFFWYTGNVFNVDELSQKLMKKWKLSSDLKQMIDQINNWSPLYGSVSLISQLTTSDIIKVETWIVVDTKERTLEDGKVGWIPVSAIEII